MISFLIGLGVGVVLTLGIIGAFVWLVCAIERTGSGTFDS